MQSDRTIRAASPIIWIATLAALGNALAWPAETSPQKDSAATESTGTWAIEGTCVDGDLKPLADVEVELLRRVRLIEDGRSVGAVRTGADGRFRFGDLPVVPMASDKTHSYYVTARLPGLSSAMTVVSTGDPKPRQPVLKLLPQPARLSGRITDEQNRPVKGAIFAKIPVGRGPCASIWAAETDAKGEFAIEDLTPAANEPPGLISAYFRVYHKDFPVTVAKVTPGDTRCEVVVDHGVVLKGRVLDAVSGKPASDAIVLAKGLATDADGWGLTDNEGRFTMRLAPDRYVFRAMVDDRACIAVNDVEVSKENAPQDVELTVVEGGVVHGKVVDSETRQPLSVDASGRPFHVGHRGPGFPIPNGAYGATFVKPDGTFKLRMAPGANKVFIAGVDRTIQMTPGPDVTISNGQTIEMEISVKKR